MQKTANEEYYTVVDYLHTYYEEREAIEEMALATDVSEAEKDDLLDALENNLALKILDVCNS